MRTAVLVALLLLPAPASPQDVPTQTLQQTGFEHTPILGVIVPGWERVSDLRHPDFNRIDVVRDSARARSGDHFLRFRTEGNDTSLQMRVRDTLPVPRDLSLLLQVHVRIVGRRLNHALLSVRWLDPLSRVLSEQRSSPLAQAADWTPLQLRVLRAPPGAVWAQVRLSYEGPDYRGECHFDDLTVVGLPRVEVVPVGRPSPLFPADQPASFSLRIPATASPDRTVITRVLDIDEAEIVAREETRVTDEKPVIRSFALPPGYYELESRVQVAGSLIADLRTPFAVLTPSDSVPSDLVGLNLNPFHTEYRNVAEFFSVLGVRRAKVSLWETAGGNRERPPAAEELSGLLRSLVTSNALGLTGVIAAIPEDRLSDADRSSPHLSPLHFFSRNRSDWERTFRSTLNRYGEWISLWQIGADADPSAASFPAASRALDQIRALLREEEQTAALALPFPASSLPLRAPSGADVLSLFIDTTSSPSSSAPSPSSEHHWSLAIPPFPSGSRAEAQRAQAAELLRNGIEWTAQSGGMATCYLPFQMDDHMGLLDAEGNPRPLFLAARAWNTLLQGAELSPEFHLFLPPVIDRVFQRGEETIVAFWSPGEPISQELYLNPEAKLIDPFGAPVTLKTGAAVRADSVPRFITGFDSRLLQTQISLQFFDPARLDQPDPSLPLRTRAALKTLRMKNHFSEELTSLHVRVVPESLPPRWKVHPLSFSVPSLGPGGWFSGDLQITTPQTEDDAPKPITFDVSFRHKGREYVLRLERRLQMAPEIQILLQQGPADAPSPPGSRQITINVENRTTRTMTLTIDVQLPGQPSRPRTFTGVLPGGGLPQPLRYFIEDVESLPTSQRSVRVTVREAGAGRAFSNRLEPIR